MRVEGDGWVVAGDAVDVRDRSVTPVELEAAVANPTSDETKLAAGQRVTEAGEDATRDGIERVRVRCAEPGPLQAYVGVIDPRSMQSFQARPALVAAARSRGIVTESMPALTDARAALGAIEVPAVDLAGARKRVAAARRAASSVQSDVAAARGALQARDGTGREDGDGDADPGREAASAETERGAADASFAAERGRLQEAIATASERETELVAAEQALARARQRAQAARDARSRRLELEDHVGRLERTVRAELLDAIQPTFLDAIDVITGHTCCRPRSRVDDSTLAVPANPGADGNLDGDDRTGSDRACRAGADAVTAALAVTRVAAIDAPIVLGTDRFQDPDVARELVGAPVIVASPSPAEPGQHDS